MAARIKIQNITAQFGPDDGRLLPDGGTTRTGIGTCTSRAPENRLNEFPLPAFLRLISMPCRPARDRDEFRHAAKSVNIQHHPCLLPFHQDRTDQRRKRRGNPGILRLLKPLGEGPEIYPPFQQQDALQVLVRQPEQDRRAQGWNSAKPQEIGKIDHGMDFPPDIRHPPDPVLPPTARAVSPARRAPRTLPRTETPGSSHPRAGCIHANCGPPPRCFRAPLRPGTALPASAAVPGEWGCRRSRLLDLSGYSVFSVGTVSRCSSHADPRVADVSRLTEGFAIYPAAPCPRPHILPATLFLDDRMIMGMSVVSGSLYRMRVAGNPMVPGIIMSIRTAGGLSPHAMAIASRASPTDSARPRSGRCG